MKRRGRGPEDAVPSLVSYARREVRLRGRPFDFAAHAYLRELYELRHPRTVFMKAAQVGLSTLHIVKAAWLARFGGGKTLYLFPTETLARLFAADRVPALLAGAAGQDVRYCRVGAGAVMFRGVWNEAGVRAQEADFVVLDELDAAPPARLALAEDRLLHSPLAWIAHLSTPTFPGTGIARLFEASDQRRWLVKCAGCGWEGDMSEDPEACLRVDGGGWRSCRRCGRGLAPDEGRWVAAYPSRATTRGYHLNHLITALPAAEIRRQWEAARTPYEVQRFHNSVLGLPYVPAGAAVDDAALAPSYGDYAPGPSGAPTIAGVDVGDELHALAAEADGGGLKVVGVAVLAGFDELAAFLSDFRATVCVVDAMPYKSSVLDLAQRAPCRLVLAYFGGGGYGTGLEKFPGGYAAKITLDRTLAIDRALSWLKGGRVTLPDPRHPAVAAFARHVKALRRFISETSAGSWAARWASAGPDHFAMALTYLVAAAALGEPWPAPAPAAAVRRRF